MGIVCSIRNSGLFRMALLILFVVVTIHASAMAAGRSFKFKELKPGEGVVFEPGEIITIYGDAVTEVDGVQMRVMKVNAQVAIDGKWGPLVSGKVGAHDSGWKLLIGPFEKKQDIQMAFSFEGTIPEEVFDSVWPPLRDDILNVLYQQSIDFGKDKVSGDMIQEAAEGSVRAGMISGYEIDDRLSIPEYLAKHFDGTDCSFIRKLEPTISSVVDQNALKLLGRTARDSSSQIAIADLQSRTNEQFFSGDDGQSQGLAPGNTAILRGDENGVLSLDDLDRYISDVDKLRLKLTAADDLDAEQSARLDTARVLVEDWQQVSKGLKSVDKAVAESKEKIKKEPIKKTKTTSARVADVRRFLSFDNGLMSSPAIGDVRNFFVINAKLMAVEQDEDLGKIWQNPLKRMTISGGLSVFDIGATPDMIDTRPFFLGLGYRINKYARVLIGTLIFEKHRMGGEDATEVVDQSLKFETAVGVSVSVEALGTILEAFGGVAKGVGEV